MKNYEEIIEVWVKDFYNTMEEGPWRPGYRGGDEPPGVKIIFDGYGYNEETDEEDDENILSFAVFVHKNSRNEEFPEHVQTPWALIHRPKEEVCIWVWYTVDRDLVEIIPFEDGDTELPHELIYEIIDGIWKEYYETEMD